MGNLDLGMGRGDFLRRGVLGTVGVMMGIGGMGREVVGGSGAVFVGVGEGQVYDLGNMRIRVMVGGEETDGMYEVFEEVTEPGFGPPLHTHVVQWEVLEVLEGRYKFKAGDEVFVGEAGSLVVVPPGVAHCFVNIAEGASRLRFMLSPRKNFEGFVKAMTELGEMPGPEQLGRLLDEYGMELKGAPLGVED